jgi:DnaJ domain
MATGTYSEKQLHFREDAAKDGLRFVLSQLLSLIPAALGHFIDRLLGLDHLIFKKSNSHIAGLFGFILGIVPYLIGFIVGEVLQKILNIPMVIGFIIDKGINAIASLFNPETHFDKGMLGQHLGIAGTGLGFIYGGFTFLTEVPPKLMEGPFAFFLGIIPHTVCFVFNRIAEVFICPLQFGIDKLCDIIRPTQPESDKESQNNLPEPSEEAVPKKSRYQRPRETLSSENSELQQVEEKKIDLFKLLGLTLDQFERDNGSAIKAYKKLAKKYHPDKNPDINIQEKFQEIVRAKTILENEGTREHYIKWYKKNMPPTFFASEPTNAQPEEGPRRTFNRPESTNLTF